MGILFPTEVIYIMITSVNRSVRFLKIDQSQAELRKNPKRLSLRNLESTTLFDKVTFFPPIKKDAASDHTKAQSFFVGKNRLKLGF